MKRVLTASRWLLLFFLVVLMLAIAGYIVLYSLGVKIDFANWRLEKTGMLFVKSSPAKAVVKLDGQVKAEGTPIKIRWLFPGQYRLEVCQEEYHCWNKTIEIEPGLVTEEKNVRLFLKKPEQEFVARSERVLVLDGQDAGYLFDQKKISFFSLTPKRKRELVQLKEKIKEVLINSDQSKVLINQKLVINLLNGKTILKLDRRFSKYRNFRFSPGNPDLLLARFKNQLSLIDLNTKEPKKLWTIKERVEYLSSQEGLLVLNKRQSPAMLYLIDWQGKAEVVGQEEIKSQGEEEEILSLADLSLARRSDQALLVDQNSRFYQLQDKELFYLGDSLYDLRFDPRVDNRYLFSNRSGEIWLDSPPEKPGEERRRLLTRLTAQPFSLRFLGYGYLTYLANQKLQLCDYQGQNSLQILPKTKLRSYWLLDNEKILIYTLDKRLIKLKIS